MRFGGQSLRDSSRQPRQGETLRSNKVSRTGNSRALPDTTRYIVPDTTKRNRAVGHIPARAVFMLQVLIEVLRRRSAATFLAQGLPPVAAHLARYEFKDTCFAQHCGHSSRES